MSVTVRKFGVTKKGEKVSLYTIKNSNGTEADVMDFGATLVAFRMKDKSGIVKDLVLGFDEAKPYFKDGNLFGATVGPIANRTAKAKFVLNGKEYLLKPNDGENNLHTSHKKGFQKRLFKGEAGKNSVTFSIKKKDMSMGHPGNLDVKVTYTLTDKDELKIHYYATTDKETYINLTNHSYFNLNGHDSGNIFHETVRIFADAYTPVAKGAIPTGEIAPVEGTPMDFTEGKTIGRDFDLNYEQLKLTNGYDHNFVIDGYDGTLRHFATLKSNKTGIVLDGYTTMPGVQVYAGNFVESDEGKNGASYRAHDGVCLETQFFPNSANQEGFVSPVINGNEEYCYRTEYRFSC